MARGTVPKATRIRDHDNTRRMQEFTTLTPDDVVRGPDLPADVAWPEQTVALYEALRRDPVGQSLTEADWCHVVDTMSLHRLLWDGGSNAIKVAAEVRLRLNQLGVTPESRMRLRMLIKRDAGDEPASKLDELRRRAAENDAKTRRRRVMKLATDIGPETATGKA